MANNRGALVTQPPFASQIRTVPSPLGVNIPLQRGYMIWSQQNFLGYTGGPIGDGRDIINFLFNPSTVNTDYNVANASLQAAMMYTVPGDSGNLLAPLLQQTVSWQLYFDRTYELNYGGNSGQVNDPAVIGVQADIYQFMQFTGILATLNNSGAKTIQGYGGNAVGSASNGSANPVTTGGVMMMVPCYVFFGNALAQIDGNANNWNIAAVASQLAYYGFISEWSVTYTHWTAAMVPIRASITINFTMLPNPPIAEAQAVWSDATILGRGVGAAPLPNAGSGQRITVTPA